VLSGEVLLGAVDWVKAFDEAAVDGGGGFAVELLVDDALDEGLEGGLRAGDAEVEGAGSFEESGEFWVGGGEVAEGECSVVTGWAWGVKQTCHDSDGNAAIWEMSSFCKPGLIWCGFTNVVLFIESGMHIKNGQKQGFAHERLCRGSGAVR
jgi:hypothetical protein